MVSISAFEAHSGSTSHHPSDNIYLENGYNLRDILNAGQEAAQRGDNIVEALKHAIGVIQGNVKRKIVCTKCGSEGKRLVSCSGPRCSNIYHPGIIYQNICRLYGPISYCYFFHVEPLTIPIHEPCRPLDAVHGVEKGWLSKDNWSIIF